MTGIRVAAGPPGMDSKVLLAKPLLDNVASVFLTTVVAGGLTLSSFIQYSKQESATGEIASATGFSAVTADQAGIIAAVSVHSGQHVQRGQVIATLEPPPTITNDGDTATRSVERLTGAIRNIDTQLGEYGRSMRQARADIAIINENANLSVYATRSRREATLARQRIIEQRLGGYEELAKDGFVTNLAVDQVRSTAMQLRQEAADNALSAAEVERGRSDRITATEARVHDMEQAALALQTQRLQIQNQLQQQDALRTHKIVAPRAGVVSVVSVKPGQRVEQNERLAAIVENNSRFAAVLAVPSKAIGLIEVGQRVSIKYDAFPYQTYGVRYGRVSRVEQASLQTGTPIDPDPKQPGRTFAVEVTPFDHSVSAEGKQHPLKIGMTLTADVEVDRRTLLAWFVEPLLSLKGRF